MSNVKDRLLRFIQRTGISTAEFERSIGVSGGYVSNISKSIQPDKLEIISKVYPALNIEWLLIDTGKMIKPHRVSSFHLTAQPYEETSEGLAAQRIKDIIQYLNTSIGTFAEKIDISQDYLSDALEGGRESGTKLLILQSIIKSFDFINPEWLILGEGSMLKSENPHTTTTVQEEGTPLLPVEAWGGSLSGSSIAVLAEQCKRYNVPISNIDYLIPIAGDSMMPDYCPGDVVAIKRINERAFIEWGKVYVLDTCNGVVIKEVQPSDNDERITCISRNTPTKYKPFEISLNPEYFYGMYAVKGTVRIS